MRPAPKRPAKNPRRDRYTAEEGYPAVPGLTAPDDHTVEIRLKEPYPQLQFVLAMPYTCIVPHEALAYYGEEFLNHAVGTGPYRVVEYRPDAADGARAQPHLPRRALPVGRERSASGSTVCSPRRASACR